MLTHISPGKRVRVVAPYSEVCCHMRVAGRPVEVELLETRFEDRVYHSAQLYVDGKPFSSPVTCGEAGIRRDGDRFYVHADDGPGDADPDKVLEDMHDLIVRALTLNPSDAEAT